ncbi:MAG: enoyl-CoA hydratase/isomerase family protein [Alphaproteobacteria bacterium]|nr:enoyl-CoA hydratase/isomerase family protein [Alphaproteobacteria bacterium]
MSRTVQVDRDGAIAIVVLNRPEVLNAVNEELRDAFVATLGALNADPTVAAVVITGAGERAFSAGQDIAVSLRLRADTVGDWFRGMRRFYQAIREMDKPVVAALNGLAAGAGFQVALHGDMRIAHAGVSLSQPEVDAGLPSILGSMIMREVMGLSRTVEMALSCRQVPAEEGHRHGLISEIVPAGEVLPRAVGLARSLAEKPPIALKLIKRRVREATQAAFDDAIDASLRLQRQAFASGEPRQAAEAFLARRRARA